MTAAHATHPWIACAADMPAARRARGASPGLVRLPWLACAMGCWVGPALGSPVARDLPIVGRIDASSGQVIEGVHVVNPSGPCIVVRAGVRNVTVRGSEIGPCGQDTRGIRDFGVFVMEGASNIVVRDNVIHDASSGLAAFKAMHPIVFDRNIVYNIRGPAWAGQMLQFNGVRGGAGRSRITCNVFDGLVNTPVAGPNNVGDHISIYASSGTAADPIEIAFNRIRGAASALQESGSGMQLGDSEAGGGAAGRFDAGGWIWAHDNTIVRVNGVGIGVAGGSNITVERNRVENRGDDLASMTGWAFAAVAFSPGSNVVFRDNVGVARLWAFNHDGSAGVGLYQEKVRRFSALVEEGNRYGPVAELSPAIFDEPYRECE